jgi:deoxycytidine triphosphate deaminase
MADGKLVVSPILCARQLGASSIDLRVGNVFLMVRARGLSVVDPARFAHTDDKVGDYEYEQQARSYTYDRGLLVAAKPLQSAPLISCPGGASRVIPPIRN